MTHTIDNSRRAQQRGLILLMQRYPSAAITKVEENDSWLMVETQASVTKHYAIWRNTGDVYEMNGWFGEVQDPMLITCDYKP